MLQKVDNRWSILKENVNSKADMFGNNYNRIRVIYHVIDTLTGYVVTMLPKNQIKKFISTFDSMNFTYNITSDKYTNALYDKNTTTQHYITVCEYVSGCGRFRIRSWTKYEGSKL